MKIFYGTGNVSKLQNMRSLLEGMPIELLSPAELPLQLPEIPETGATPLENARLKAHAYYRATHLPSFALDSGLYLQGLPDSGQPGPYVRRVGQKTLTDEEFIRHYSAIAHKHGGRVKARFLNGLCLVLDEHHCKEAFGASVSTDWFWIVDTPCRTRLEGFPMDSIAIDPETGAYWVEKDLDDAANAKGSTLAGGIRRFFSELLEGDFRDHIESTSGR